MKTSTQSIGRNKVRLTVEVEAEQVERLIARTYRRLARQVKVPGFRPGRAPKAVIDQRLGRDFVRSEALRDLLPGLVAKAVREEALDVVAPPSIDVKRFEDGADLTFEATVETRPAPELKEYSGLAVTKPKVEVTEEEVAAHIEELRRRFATLEPSERPLVKGDFALVDLTTYRHELTIDELTAKDLLIEVGAGMVTEDLDRELLGKRRGDILKLTTTLPERFGEHAGWQVGMQVLVKDTKARRLPPLDDELAKTVSEFDTLDDLREDVRRRLVEMHEARADRVLRSRVLDAFAERSVEVELPEGMVEVEVDALVRSLAELVALQGATLEKYLEENKLDLEALRARFREQAERNLRVRLGLDAVAEREGLFVTDEERLREVERLAERYGREAGEVRRMFDESGDWSSLDGDILRAKALDLLVERADVKEVEEDSATATEGDR